MVMAMRLPETLVNEKGRYLLVTEIARRVGIPYLTIARAAKEGKINALSVARRLFICIDDKFAAWLLQGYNRKRARAAMVRWQKAKGRKH